MAKYVAGNRSSIQAWPEDSPSMFILYNSPTHNAIQSYPNHLRLQRTLNELWHGYVTSQNTSPEPPVYLDGIRDRAPAYRKVYDSIFRGTPETHDPYDLSVRKDADQTLYKGIAHSTILRTFQGWTALTPTAPREGTIMIYPNIKTVIAYLLLRPFFRPPHDSDVDLIKPELWTLDEEETGWFPGIFKTESQRWSRTSHPHLRLEECLLHMPKINPGDTLWWHCDFCHAVDTEHLGEKNASDAFIDAFSTTAVNKDYIRRQLAATLAAG